MSPAVKKRKTYSLRFSNIHEGFGAISEPHFL